MKHLAWILLISLGGSLASAQEPKKGEFQTTFTERSPLSAKPDLMKRLGDIPDAPDYDLAKEPFTVYVPENYDPAVAHGIIVWINYKATTVAPEPWKPVLGEKHLIFIASVNNDRPEWVRAGLSVDAVHNLKKLYTINDDRVYLFGYGNANEYTPQRVGFALPDVFRGFMYIIGVQYYRQIMAPGGRSFFPPKMPRPPSAMMPLSKTRRHIIAPDSESPTFGEQVAKAYVEDGFTHVLSLPVSRLADVHYPAMTTPWLEKALAFLDAPLPASAAKPATLPVAARGAAAPATRPAASEAQRLLNLAKSYITAKNYPQARTRLQEIINSYPNDPAAKDARQLLDEIKGK